MKETAQSLCRLMFRVEVWCLGAVVYRLLDSWLRFRVEGLVFGF